MPLTVVQIKAAKPGEKPYKLADERGLYLLVNPSGSKLWGLSQLRGHSPINNKEP